MNSPVMDHRVGVTRDKETHLASETSHGAFDGPQPAGLIGAALVAVLLSACSDVRMDDLYAFVQQTKAQQHGAIEPLPAIKTFETFTYLANDVRDPFVPPTEPEPEAPTIERTGNGLSPNFERPREELERFALDSLRMVGTLAQDEEMFGVVLAPGGSVYRVQYSNYLGKNHGRITGISEEKIELTEIVPDGADGWEERQAALALSE